MQAANEFNIILFLEKYFMLCLSYKVYSESWEREGGKGLLELLTEPERNLFIWFVTKLEFDVE